jgi:hypothetical protein
MIGVTNDEQIFYGSMLYYWRKQQHITARRKRAQAIIVGERKLF